MNELSPLVLSFMSFKKSSTCVSSSKLSKFKGIELTSDINLLMVLREVGSGLLNPFSLAVLTITFIS